MAGKWFYVSDSGPDEGCGIVLVIIIALTLIRGCRQGVGGLRHAELARKHLPVWNPAASCTMLNESVRGM